MLSFMPTDLGGALAFGGALDPGGALRSSRVRPGTITLYVTPVVYTYVARDHAAHRARPGPAPQGQPAE